MVLLLSEDAPVVPKIVVTTVYLNEQAAVAVSGMDVVVPLQIE